MRGAQVRPDGTTIRWVELPGAEPTRVYLHGLGASSSAYYAAVATNPALAGRRSLLMDLLGHGISDRPADASYTLEEHADLLATALTAAGVSAAEVIAHSMGGAVAIVLAARHPHLVSALVLVDATLDPQPPGVGIGARYTEEQFVNAPESAPPGRQRCGSLVRRRSIALRHTSTAAPPPPCVSCCSNCPCRAHTSTRPTTNRSVRPP